MWGDYPGFDRIGPNVEGGCGDPPGFPGTIASRKQHSRRADRGLLT